ncbi:MAG: cyclic nucleotide-binding domain-containing protein [Rhizobiales bacterium]|nr:cyclic nucleotide-binding domain-containing protein [Hyphomicrobiales bacterium]
MEIDRPDFPLLQQLSDSEQAMLFRAGRVVAYPAGCLVQSRGDQKPGLSVLVEGRLRIGNYTQDGALITLLEIGPGQSFGEMTVLIDLPRTYDVTALEPAKVLQISAPKTRELLDTMPVLSHVLLRMLAARLHRSLSMMDDFRQKRPLERLKTLLRESVIGSEEGGLYVQALQTELAYTIGVSRITLGKLLEQLEKAGIIRRGYRKIEILRPEQLSN